MGSRKRLRHSPVSCSVDVMIVGRRRVDFVNTSDAILKMQITLHELPPGNQKANRTSEDAR